MTCDDVVLESAALTVRFASMGAELQSIADERGVEFLWQAGPQWRRRAPILFPAICRVGVDDVLRVDEVEYPMTQHGFARDSEFSVVDVTGTSASFVLVSDDATRAHFPYDFALAVTYGIDGSTLHTSYEVENRGEVAMPFSLGSHPAFVWDPTLEVPSVKHVAFEAQESAPYRRVVDNLLSPVFHDSLVVDRSLAVDWPLFEDGAVIMPEVASSSLRFGSAGGRLVELAWQGFSGITLWTKPDAEFLCVEPWRGIPAPEGFDGEWATKPGNTVLAPADRLGLSYSITLI